MLLLLLAGVWLGLVALPYGTWSVARLRAGLRRHVADGPVGATLTWLLGLALLTALLQAWSLLAPLNGWAFAGAALGSLGLFALDRQAFWATWRGIRQTLAGWRAGEWVAAAVLATELLLLATLPSINGDTAVYHAQSLRWLEQFGAVPGLANIDTRLGYNSAWFVPQTLASWAQWVGSPLHTLNAAVLLIYAGYALAALPALRRQPTAAGLLRVLLLPLLAFWCADDLASLSPDPAVAMLAFVVLSQAAAAPLPGRPQPWTLTHAVLALLAVFAVTIKLSAGPLLLLPLLWLLRRRPAALPGFLARMSAAALLLVLPWMLRTVVLTGYLLFPFPALDVLPLDWKFPRNYLFVHADYIRKFARNWTLQEGQPYLLPLRQWLPIWWQQQLFFDRLLTMLAPVVGLLSGLLLLRSATLRRQLAGPVAVVALVAAAGVGYWFAVAPAYRFGLGFILSLFALLLLPAALLLARRWPRPVATSISLLAVAALTAKLLMVELRFFATPRYVPAAEFPAFLADVVAPEARAFVQQCYQPDSSHTAYLLRPGLPLGGKLRLLGTLLRSGALARQSQGLAASGRRLLRPAPYPDYSASMDTVQLSGVRLLQYPARPDPNRYGVWYAPFPFAAYTRGLKLRTGELSGGFRQAKSKQDSDTPTISSEN
ncbi:LIC_10190 family membrane protein [Hymenobacter sp. B81]|uniref:LIC_10190 family membrane protein n=1 Tax=Hymenobacter sp. B81 TaxID=3344878 RepID=UPI0037DDBC5B